MEKLKRADYLNEVKSRFGNLRQCCKELSLEYNRVYNMLCYYMDEDKVKEINSFMAMVKQYPLINIDDEFIISIKNRMYQKYGNIDNFVSRNKEFNKAWICRLFYKRYKPAQRKVINKIIKLKQIVEDDAIRPKKSKASS